MKCPHGFSSPSWCPRCQAEKVEEPEPPPLPSSFTALSGETEVKIFSNPNVEFFGGATYDILVPKGTRFDWTGDGMGRFTAPDGRTRHLDLHADPGDIDLDPFKLKIDVRFGAVAKAAQSATESYSGLQKALSETASIMAGVGDSLMKVFVDNNIEMIRERDQDMVKLTYRTKDIPERAYTYTISETILRVAPQEVQIEMFMQAIGHLHEAALRDSVVRPTERPPMRGPNINRGWMDESELVVDLSNWRSPGTESD